jgi:hypothetical protein
LKNCSYCGRENQDSASQCWECGTEFQTAKEEFASPPKKAEAFEVFPDPEPDVSPAEEIALCISCLFPNSPEAAWCKRCGAAISPTVTITMPDAALTVGCVYRNAVRGHPKPFVLMGVWLLFFPTLVFSLLAMLSALADRTNGLAAFFTFWVSVYHILVSCVLLYRVTWNHFNIPKIQLDEIP